MPNRRIKERARLEWYKRLASYSENQPVTAWVAKINNRWMIGGNYGRLLK